MHFVLFIILAPPIPTHLPTNLVTELFSYIKAPHFICRNCLCHCLDHHLLPCIRNFSFHPWILCQTRSFTKPNTCALLLPTCIGNPKYLSLKDSLLIPKDCITAMPCSDVTCVRANHDGWLVFVDSLPRTLLIQVQDTL